METDFEAPEHFGELEGRFAALSDTFTMRWKMTRAGVLKRVAIMASKADHGFQELMWRVHSGELNADIRMVISNHLSLAPVAARWGVPFHHVPVSKGHQAPGGGRAAQAPQR